ncbi:HWE histidine kinase domain-containing protein [Erythrobacter sp.]|uniref:HWE histidine kinase domain-containing protein n=1 Tax=Erythrobacter sp. TaxID=1042 RepID=UPI002E988EBA|nr:HWE histidine kinase domain-containing protein [Erythrobacter sp.]
MIDDPHLDVDSHKALAQAQPVEREVRDGDGRKYLREVRPLARSNGGAPGVVARYIEIASNTGGAQSRGGNAWQAHLVAQLGQIALAARDLSKFFDEACNLLHKTFACDYTKILKLNHSETSFGLIAGCGWKPGLVGAAETGVGRRSQAGYTLLVENTVLVEDLDNDHRLDGPQLLVDHGVRSGISALISVGGKPWGVIGLHSRSPGAFSQDDLAVLKSVANIIAMTIMQSTREAFLTRERIIQSLSMGVAEIGVWTMDVDTHAIVWDQRFRAITGLTDTNVQPVMDEFTSRIVDEHRSDFEAAFAALLQGDEPQEMALRYVRPDGEMVWLDVRSERVEQNGKPLIIGIVADISERKESEERSEFMMRELDHRVKNLLAIILSIAEITSRSTDEIDIYKRDFRGRLESMARTHSLLAKSHWSGLEFEKLIQAELQSFASPTAVDANGPAIALSPGAAQSLAMFLHELAANAKKHGALCADDGVVEVRWDVIVGEKCDLEFSWREKGGPAVSEPDHEGFGSKVINRIVKRQLDADVSASWEKDGLCLAARFPLSKVLPASAADIRVQNDLSAPVPHRELKGKRILVVDDEWLIAEQHAEVFASLGARIAGPYVSLAEASREDLAALDCAVLDFALSTEGDILPLAHRLADLEVPILFVVGHDSHIDLPERLADAPVLFKPATADALIAKAARLIEQGRGSGD